MTPARLCAAVGVVALATLAAACAKPAPAPEPEAAVTTEVQAWRDKHEADYRRDWVTIAGLHFLHEGAQTAGSAKTNDVVLPASAPATVGRFVVEGASVRFEPAAGAPVDLKGTRVTAPVVLKDDSGSGADELVTGTVKIAVHVSGNRRSLRVWDPEGPLARGFKGFTWFPIQLDQRVTGRFIPDASPRTLQVTNTFGDLDTFTTQGVVEFTLNGQTLRLRPFTTRPKRFYFVFKDASSGTETYAAARFLYADLKDDGTAVLDFNQAYNPPCAFNPYTTCPIPLPENRLPVKVLAGERAYPDQVELPAS
ncbi:MAG TPA: DUF1684 domain-containing protein [Vicinamibacterales bacterium]|nr:DUF1684 domain-containing protein [Vicinamibacterales bacterium]